VPGFLHYSTWELFIDGTFVQQDLSLITPVHDQDDDTNYTQENTEVV